MSAVPTLTLVILAAGRATRFGRLKQLEPVGPNGETLLDYGAFDAWCSGFRRVVLVVPPGMEDRFRSHLDRHLGDAVEIQCVGQSLEDVPSGFAPAPHRTKPWGTAHAVLAARGALNGPFAVANADDLYGRSAYRALAAHAGQHPDQAALVGYKLSTTLSDHGGVSRGICEVDGDGYLTTLVEATEVTYSGGEIRGITVDGRSLQLRGTEPTSMNLWGFPLRLLDLLQQEWVSFFERRGNDATAEFLLSTMTDDLVKRGALRLRVLATDADWIGMTFGADVAMVRHRIAELVASGEYPVHLWEGLS
jgi:hypothetical protein